MTTLDKMADHDEVTARLHVALRWLLADYATAAACGRAPERQFPAVAAHVARCADCRAALHDLLELVAVAFNGDVDPAPAYPRADLTFLRCGTSSPIDAD